MWEFWESFEEEGKVGTGRILLLAMKRLHCT